MEVPRLGVEWKLQLPAYTTVTAMPDLSHIFDLLGRKRGLLTAFREGLWAHALPTAFLEHCIQRGIFRPSRL